ncbi:phosphoglycerate kinase [Halanaerobacter jeridensis]|uniref:Phosphoglycerate kinase n=1 Tax=Halanaerobacter jeridensis TaxID=706427 RepID=A0A939BQX8_9FIRM|nr:phosphoglycerate kinase [Halanaerobacter jeridensis]MBM7556809.1 phosphoglycerate kinase [Halanaerobacter jeridensis]
MEKKTLKDVAVKGKKVLVRVDFNVPVDDDGNVTDDTRIEAALPTINYLKDEGAKVILMAHFGRPGGEVQEDLRLDPVAKALAERLGETVTKTDDTVGEEAKEAIAKLKEGNVLLLENTRFNAGEKSNDEEFSKQLAELCDVYVNDAFGAAHRAHASTAGVAQYAPEAVAGFLMQNEIETMKPAVEEPAQPYVAIVGGAKISDKMSTVENLMGKAKTILIGGGMANTFIKAQGYEVGDSLLEEDQMDLANELVEKAEAKGVDLILPIDVTVADDFAADANHKAVAIDEIEEGWQALDIGPKTIEKFADVLADAKTVTWNGPLGVFEMDAFAKGTNEVAKVLGNIDATTIVGGGESAAAVKKAGLEDAVTHISTGGGASLRVIEGKPLPAFNALNNK